jgi:hypothetical protein
MLWQKLWKINTIPRHKTLLWRILNNSLPIRNELHTRGVNCSLLCPRCNSKLETLTHLFMDCPLSERVWFGSQLSINIKSFNQQFPEWIAENILNKDAYFLNQMAAITYSLWHARNQAVFEDVVVPELTIIQRASSSVAAFLQATSDASDTLHDNYPLALATPPISITTACTQIVTGSNRSHLV